MYAITNLHAAQASPARLADYIRGHWGIEALHHIRDVTFADYAAPWIMLISRAVGRVYPGQRVGVR